ncbi:MAG: response regulator transcription factor [Pseudomonadota bacterium]
MTETTVIVADDHPLFRAAMIQAVAEKLPEARVAEADSLPALQEALTAADDVDLLLMDLHMPGANGFSGLAFINQRYPDVPVLMISADEDRNIISKAVEMGASGFIPKSASIEQIGEAIERVLEGETWLPEDLATRDGTADTDSQDMAARVAELTPQQYRVLHMIADGMLNKQIAYDLEVSEATVKAHMTAIMRKLGVRTRTQAVLALSKLDLPPPHERERRA